MNSTTSAGMIALRLVSAFISPSSITSTIFVSIVWPIPLRLFAFPTTASWATGPPVSRMRVAARR